MKKICILFSLILVLSINSFSQTNPGSDTTYWGISLYGSPNYNMQMIKGGTPAGQDAGFMKDIDLPHIGYQLGISIYRPLAKKLAIEFGIQMQCQGYKTGTLSDTLWNYRDSAIGYSDYKKAYRYYSVNIPILLKVNLFRIKKARVDFGVGVAPMISLGKKEVMYFDDHTENINEKSGKDLNVQAIGCLSVYIPLCKKTSLTLEPTFRYDILPYKDNYYVGVSHNLMTVGLGMYLTYKLTDDEMYDYYYRHIYNVKNMKPNF